MATSRVKVCADSCFFLKVVELFEELESGGNDKGLSERVHVSRVTMRTLVPDRLDHPSARRMQVVVGCTIEWIHKCLSPSSEQVTTKEMYENVGVRLMACFV